MAISKLDGRFYTPKYLVNNILDFGGYSEKDILKKHVIDNSCGDGAFLAVIVERYCKVYFEFNYDKDELKAELEEYIHGIEIDSEETNKCIANLNNVTQKHGIENVKWDVLNESTLFVDKFNSKIDYVFGNPPYIRVHNLKESYDSVKKFQFSKGGMTDIYIVFFEIGFNMLNPNGKMCLITPSSWLHSNAGLELRKHIAIKNNLIGLIDLEHYQPFEATTYTLISLFSKEENTNKVEYCVYDIENKDRKHVANINLSDLFINNNIYLATEDKLHEIKTIFNSIFTKKYVEVKNGFATLCDRVFIGKFDFKSKYIIDIIKASTNKWYECFYPYDEQGRPIPLETIQKDESLYSYLLENKEVLTNERDIQNKDLWYLFGRTQALKDVHKSKIVVNTTLKNKESIKISFVESGQGVYSGLYILTDVKFETIKKILVSDEFIGYVSMLKKYKSGGYYTISSKELELFLNYKLSLQYGQQIISKSDNSLF